MLKYLMEAVTKLYAEVCEKIQAFSSMDIKVLDIETLKTLDETHSYLTLGVSVCVFYSLQTGRFSVYTENDWRPEELKEEMAASDVIVGHNICKFDYPVLEGKLGESLAHLIPKTVDFYRSIVAKHSDFKTGEICMVSLDNLVKNTVDKGLKKTMNGLVAIELWNTGDPAKQEQVIEYCKTDVLLTAMLFLKSVLLGGRVCFMNPLQIQRLKQGVPLTRRIKTTAIINYPAVLKELIPKPPKKKPLPKLLKVPRRRKDDDKENH